MKIGKKYKSYYSTVYECVGISDAVNNAVGSSQNWLGAVEVTVPSK
jgi:hypothetical protein